MTELERLGQKSILAEYKAENAGSPRMAEMLIEKWGSKNNPDVVKALSEGAGVFRLTFPLNLYHSIVEVFNIMPPFLRTVKVANSSTNCVV